MNLPDNVSIRPAVPDDLDAIVALWTAMMREHEEFDPRIRLAPNADIAYRNYAYHHIREGAAVFVAEYLDKQEGGRQATHRRQVVGFALAYVARNLPMYQPERYGYLSDLVVAAPWRRCGIGTALLDCVRQRLRREEVAQVQLQVYSKNVAGLGFWRQQGFDDFVHGLWAAL
ncbi:MAG: GNAT family N-acetyltransferase [Candidatus Sumerlaeia bacterium]|nr:GNAT family N-acetyltransferase [Candidatus Sumerlaeia bacterium]